MSQEMVASVLFGNSHIAGRNDATRLRRLKVLGKLCVVLGHRRRPGLADHPPGAERELRVKPRVGQPQSKAPYPVALLRCHCRVRALPARWRVSLRPRLTDALREDLADLVGAVVRRGALRFGPRVTAAARLLGEPLP